MNGQYSIGSDHVPGLSKLIEELGECSQVAGKIIGFSGMGKHWDGADLKDRLTEEMADVTAAIAFVSGMNGIDIKALEDRRVRKIALFEQWHRDQSE